MNGLRAYQSPAVVSFCLQGVEYIAFNRNKRRAFKLMVHSDNATDNWKGSLIKTNRTLQMYANSSADKINAELGNN